MLSATSARVCRGFTLIEMMVTVVILAILSSIALPSFREMMENTRIRTTAESIQNGMQLARAGAIARNTQVRFRLGVNSDWTVGCVNVTPDCPDPIQSRPTKEGSTTDITVTPSPAGAASVVFNGFGSVVAAADTIATIDVDSTALDASVTRELRIVTGVGGTVRMCDPAKSPPDVRAC